MKKEEKIMIPGKLSTTKPEEAQKFILKLAKYPPTFLNSLNCAKS
jgi:hypothetical protein